MKQISQLNNMKSYFLHTRPQSFLVTFFAAVTGYAISPEKPIMYVDIAMDLLLLFFIFSILLWGGTNAFNSGQDGNEGALTLLPNPPLVPKYLSAFGLSLMGLALIFTYFISLRLMLLTLLGVLLSVFYSYKNSFFKRGKDIPVIDMLINTVGFGLCSILFGFMMTSAPVTPQILLIGIGFTFTYLGGMPTSQIFQLKEQAVTNQNYTSLLGVSGVLKLGAFFFILHVIFIGFAYTDLSFLRGNFIALTCWAGWIILVLISSIHSYWWSKEPFKNSYKRMNRQMIMMMSSQTLWTIYAWIQN